MSDNKTRIEYICKKQSCAKKELRCILIQRDKRLGAPVTCPYEFSGKPINWEIICDTKNKEAT